MNNSKITFLGGDSRLFYAAQTLAESGYNVSIFGNMLALDRRENIKYEATLSSAIENADLLVLPIPYTRDMIRLEAPLSTLEIKLGDIFSKIEKNTLIIAGMAEGIPSNFKLYDYASDEEYVQKNALATAEGAIATLIKETPYTVSGLKTAVIGYGRIARLLSKKLYLLGAKVNVVARNPVDRVRADTEGLGSASFSELPDIISQSDVIINTVPSRVICEKELALANPTLLIVDLASTPGGCDKKAVQEKGVRLINAPGLPGKYSPISSGRALAELIKKRIP